MYCVYYYKFPGVYGSRTFSGKAAAQRYADDKVLAGYTVEIKRVK